jgi:hypothetical protein
MIHMSMTRMARGVFVAVAVAGAVSAYAQEPAAETNLDVTIRLLPENAVGPQDITRRIELPPAVAAAARPEQPTEGPPPGADNGQGRGLDVATEARERGREFGQERAEQARENRENAGRPDDVGRPDDAGPPIDPPSPPVEPPGPPIEPPSPPVDPPGPPITPPGRL